VGRRSILEEPVIIWAHPGTGKTFYYQLHPELVIDFDSVYKNRLSRELNIPENYQARKEWRKLHREEYNNKIIDLFKEAIIESVTTNKHLLVSDLIILEQCENDIDIITQMSEKTFAERSEQRNEPYDINHKLWKQSIDECINNIHNKQKVVIVESYLTEYV
jgi:hypothetical protein